MASMEDSDESLMRLIAKGNHQAFAILVRRHTDRFYAACYRMTGREADAEDMVQEAFLKIWQKPDLWKEDKGAKFTTWFYRILINLNIDRMRRSKNMAPDNQILEFFADQRPGPEANITARENEELVEAAIQSLPERQRTALNLCFYEGLSNAEAADVMGVKIKALESLVMRAKAGLREFLNKGNIALGTGDRYATR